MQKIWHWFREKKPAEKSHGHRKWRSNLFSRNGSRRNGSEMAVSQSAKFDDHFDQIAMASTSTPTVLPYNGSCTLKSTMKSHSIRHKKLHPSNSAMFDLNSSKSTPTSPNYCDPLPATSATKPTKALLSSPRSNRKKNPLLRSQEVMPLGETIVYNTQAQHFLFFSTACDIVSTSGVAAQREREIDEATRNCQQTMTGFYQHKGEDEDQSGRSSRDYFSAAASPTADPTNDRNLSSPISVDPTNESRPPSSRSIISERRIRADGSDCEDFDADDERTTTCYEAFPDNLDSDGNLRPIEKTTDRDRQLGKLNAQENIKENKGKIEKKSMIKSVTTSFIPVIQNSPKFKSRKSESNIKIDLINANQDGLLGVNDISKNNDTSAPNSVKMGRKLRFVIPQVSVSSAEGKRFLSTNYLNVEDIENNNINTNNNIKTVDEIETMTENKQCLQFDNNLNMNMLCSPEQNFLSAPNSPRIINEGSDKAAGASEADRRQLSLAQRRQSNMDFVHQLSGRRASTTLIPLTSAQIHLIRSLWRQVYLSKGPTVIGQTVIYRLFFKVPNLREQFRKCPLPKHSMNHDSFSKTHCKQMAEMVDKIVENLDDLESVTPDLEKIGRAHAHVSNGQLSSKIWNSVAETFIDCTLEWGDRRARSETVRKAWALIIAFMVERIKHGHLEERRQIAAMRTTIASLERVAATDTPSGFMHGIPINSPIRKVTATSTSPPSTMNTTAFLQKLRFPKVYHNTDITITMPEDKSYSTPIFSTSNGPGYGIKSDRKNKSQKLSPKTPRKFEYMEV